IRVRSSEDGRTPLNTYITTALFAAAYLAAGLQALPAEANSSFEWRTATPESQGMSGLQLDAIKVRLASKKTKAFLVIRNDRIVYEWYAPNQSATNNYGTASLAKALVGGL